jgi:hypothetical protein
MTECTTWPHAASEIAGYICLAFIGWVVYRYTR